MTLEFTPIALPYMLAFLVNVVLLTAIWRHRDRRGAKGFILDILGILLLLSTVSMQLFSTELADKVFWWNWRFLAYAVMATGYLFMALEYTNREEWINYRTGALLLVVPVLAQLWAWTNHDHGLMYGYSMHPVLGTMVPEFGLLYWVYAVVCLTYLGIGVYFLLWLFLSQPDFTLQAGIHVATITLVLVGIVVWWLGWIPVDTLSLTSTVKVVGFYFAVDRLQMLDLVPVARTKVVDNMQDAVFVVNRANRVVSANEAGRDLVGDDVVGRCVDELFQTEFPFEVADETDVHEEVALTVDGERRHFDLRLSPLTDSRGTETGRVLVLRDITQLKHREKELTVLNRIVRHDISNEMNVVQGHGHQLREHVDESGERHLELVLESSDQVLELTDTVRDLTDALTSGGQLSVKPVQLLPTLESQLEKVRTSYGEATFSLEGTMPRSGAVLANEMLSSVFTNLLNNGVLHNDSDEPRVTVSVEEGDDTVLVRVSDNGPGIPTGHEDELFGRGVKGLESDGSGVGLYLVDTLITAYGGDVWVENDADGGAVFSIELRKAGDWPDRSTARTTSTGAETTEPARRE